MSHSGHTQTVPRAHRRAKPHGNRAQRGHECPRSVGVGWAELALKDVTTQPLRSVAHESMELREISRFDTQNTLTVSGRDR
ncbi:hypothetical protein CLE01_25300 [Cryobacterium levicorallinum]|nr:hypothetical protein CLE01_25300 [Cryobacterium levicorallinum]